MMTFEEYYNNYNSVPNAGTTYAVLGYDLRTAEIEQQPDGRMYLVVLDGGITGLSVRHDGIVYSIATDDVHRDGAPWASLRETGETMTDAWARWDYQQRTYGQIGDVLHGRKDVAQ